MELASELLELNEIDIVLAYLRACADSIPTADQRFDQWIYQIEHGQIPSFE